ncbi:MAG TPA: helix-turn-helix domain-containing protein [Candidatus Dormibacteraeota bacterium]|nr:helix-turn-helix domain-containing protein [Candidatus Dormibacteraeota bacterium]
MVNKLNVSLRKESFYINYDNESNPRNTMKHYHLHDDYEVFYLIEGERVYFINGKKFEVKENDLVFIDKNVIHKTKVNHIFGSKRVVMNFCDTLLSDDERFLLNYLFHTGPYVISIPASKRKMIETLVRNLLQEYTTAEEGANIYIRSLLIQFLVESSRLLKYQTKPFEKTTHDNHHKQDIAEIIKYINAYFSHKISLTHLSQAFNMSEHYISRLFRKVTGGGLINYLNAVRVNEAKKLLLETDMNIANISIKVGYGNNVHLWRVFKQLTGFSPNSYRETYKTK